MTRIAAPAGTSPIRYAERLSHERSFPLRYCPQGKSTFFTAIDVAKTGIVTSQTSLDQITGGHAVEFGVITASVQRVASSLCGL